MGLFKSVKHLFCRKDKPSMVEPAETIGEEEREREEELHDLKARLETTEGHWETAELKWRELELVQRQLTALKENQVSCSASTQHLKQSARLYSDRLIAHESQSITLHARLEHFQYLAKVAVVVFLAAFIFLFILIVVLL